MATHSAFKDSTTGAEVVAAFPQNVKDRIFVVTGPTAGSIGSAVLLGLAKGEPAALVIAGRTPSKFQTVVDEITRDYPAIKVVTIVLDLSSQESVRTAARQILENDEIPRIDVLINNAGIMAQPYGTTKEGIENQFGVNHIGHFLFTNLLLPKLRLTVNAQPTVVNTSSAGHRMFSGNFDDANWQNRRYNIWVAYGSGKAANIIFSKALGKRGIRSVALHPGYVPGTNLAAHLGIGPSLAFITRIMPLLMCGKWEGGFTARQKTIDEAASTVLVAALDSAIPSGSYLHDCQVHNPDPRVLNEKLPEDLWKISNELTHETFA